jgi:hypothetical protein
MADDKMSFPYVVGTAKLVSFLQKIPDIGIPEKFTLKNLKSLGFTSSNDERFIPAVKFIGFLTTTGQPTDLWKEARAHLGRALGKGIRAGYADLFNQYPNAHQKDDEALRTYFSVHSGTGKDAVTRMVQTFKSLCSIAEFQATGQASDTPKGSELGAEREKEKIPNRERAAIHVTDVPTIAINIQLQLPPDPTGEIYEKFFASMAKHLPVKR